jgi:hypothetical protein
LKHTGIACNKQCTGNDLKNEQPFDLKQPSAVGQNLKLKKIGKL